MEEGASPKWEVSVGAAWALFFSLISPILVDGPLLDWSDTIVGEMYQPQETNPILL